MNVGAGLKIRAVIDECDNLWFIAKDVGAFFDVKNHSDFMRKLDADEKGWEWIDNPKSLRKMRVVSESGLYKIIFSSRSDKAKFFQRKILEEIEIEKEKEKETEVSELFEEAERSDCQAFQFDGLDVRVVDRDGNPWFVAKDIGRALGISGRALKVALGKIKKEYRFVIAIDDSEVLIVSEQGLYKILIRSQSPLAEKFQDWITESVLPSIRRTGSYSVAKDSLSSPPPPSEKYTVVLEMISAQSKMITSMADGMVQHERVLARHEERISMMEARVADAKVSLSRVVGLIHDSL